MCVYSCILWLCSMVGGDRSSLHQWLHHGVEREPKLLLTVSDLSPWYSELPMAQCYFLASSDLNIFLSPWFGHVRMYCFTQGEPISALFLFMWHIPATSIHVLWGTSPSSNGASSFEPGEDARAFFRYGINGCVVWRSLVVWNGIPFLF